MDYIEGVTSFEVCSSNKKSSSMRRNKGVCEQPKTIKFERNITGNLNGELETEEIDLDELSFEAAYIMSEVLDKAGVELEISFTGQILPTIHGNRKCLKSAFKTIAELCVEEVEQSTAICLSIQKTNRHCIYEISYQHRENITKNDRQLEAHSLCVEKYQDIIFLKKIKNSDTRISLVL